ncbi:MAG: cation diffusion facilitator family transporter [Candidatus Hydrogenedentes bacterium]|nr:cation diffusion facilitator family transporter [Candidatus Hydrogenedentota bacterium]
MAKGADDSMQLQHIAMGASLAVAVVMLAGKLVAYHITGSAAILSDGAESVVHIAATGVAAMSLWYAARDPDDNHPYGHGKIAYFSGGFEGAMILSASFYIYYLSIRALIEGPELHRLGVGIMITAVLCLVNLALGLFLVHVGKTRNALILVANGKHVLTDMWTSAGVVAGVLIVQVTGIVWLDPLCALLVATNILVESVRLMRRAFRGLLDQADPEHASAILAALQQAMDSGRIEGFHQLKHREANDVIWIEVHMLVPGATTTAAAHHTVTGVEETISKLFPQYTVHVTTHIEPAEHDVHHPGGHPELVDPYADKSG